MTELEHLYAKGVHAQGMTDTAKARLLVVAGEQAQVRALCATLALEGYAALGHDSPRQALVSLREHQFDLLITDLVMPEIDGIALSAAARQMDPQLATILMTGHATVDTAIEAIEAIRDGALDYILKPFKPNAILAAVSRALDMQRLRRECAQIRALERQNSKELELAHRDLESYSYCISHDLRAPLRAITCFGLILEEEYADILGEEGSRLLGIMRSSTHTVDQLVMGLLEFSRVAKDARALSMLAVDMTSLAKAASLDAVMLYPGIEPEIEIADLPEAQGDATALREVWCHLIGNALKYSAKTPSPRIAVTGSVEGGEVLYQVRDNGAGFDMRYADKLFGVFQRLHGADEFQGAGMGLAIVHRIVTCHGGRIWAQGAPNKGACFQFALPAGHAASS